MMPPMQHCWKPDAAFSAPESSSSFLLQSLSIAYR